MPAVLQAHQSLQHYPGNKRTGLLFFHDWEKFALIALTFKDPHRKTEKNIMVQHQLLDQHPGSSIADNPVVILVFIFK